MAHIRITDGTRTRDITLMDDIVNVNNNNIYICKKYLELTKDKSLTLQSPTLGVAVNGIVHYPREIYQDTRETYSIEFINNWTPTDVFNSVFELVDDSGDVISTATPNTKKYRFKEDTVDYTGVYSLGSMFEECTALKSIILPPVWGDNILNVANMFNGCANLENISIPDDWNNIVEIFSMFYGCQNLRSLDIPLQWNKVTSTQGLFYGCLKLEAMILPNDWMDISNVSSMFHNCIALNDITLPENISDINQGSQISRISNMFTNTGFTYRDAGIWMLSGYYRSPAPGAFPDECWTDGIGIDM